MNASKRTIDLATATTELGRKVFLTEQDVFEGRAPTERIIRWQGRHPTEVEIEDALCRYINASGRIEKPADRFMVTLIGGSKNPFLRADDAEIFAPPFEGRVFEVYVSDECVNVMTRQQDEFTNAVAEGFAAAIAWKWNGRREGA